MLRQREEKSYAGRVGQERKKQPNSSETVIVVDPRDQIQVLSMAHCKVWSGYVTAAMCPSLNRAIMHVDIML